MRKGINQDGITQLDSQTDVDFGEKLIEVRIPWQLLNFSNPTAKRIHDDYMKHYGVKEVDADMIALGWGPAQSHEMIPMEDYPLPSWERPKVRPFLKASYSIIKKEWTKKGE